MHRIAETYAAIIDDDEATRTTKHKIGLGNRCAEAAKRYLIDLGVGGTIDTISDGEEWSLCREKGEACWSRIRRDDFQLPR